MSMSKPLWNPNLAGLLVRMPLGLYFLGAGRAKLVDPNAFIDAVKAFQILPENLAVLYGVLLPYLEITVGALLIIGLWTTAVAIVTSLLLVSYIVAIHPFPYPENPFLFNKDILLLGSTLSLLASGAGAFSVDSFRHTS